MDTKKKQYFYNIKKGYNIQAGIFTHFYSGEYDAEDAYSSFLRAVEDKKRGCYNS